MIITKPRVKIAIVPNVETIAREMTTTSQVGIILNRVKQLHISSLVTIGLNNIPYLLKIAKKDFAAGIKLLSELEILKLKEEGLIRTIALHQQMVDMAIALKNIKVIEYYLALARQYAFTPYLMTANVGPMIKLLARLRNVPPDLGVITNITRTNDGLREYMRQSNLQFMSNIGDK